MDEEEHFVNIDLNDDHICSVCKLDTDTGTLSFCHICFELSMEGVSPATLLHSKSSRGHRDCFDKCHLIANQTPSQSRTSRSAYEGMKLALSQKLHRIIQYAQNKEPGVPGRRGAKLFCYSQQGDRRLLPQTDSQVPRYAPQWDSRGTAALPGYTAAMLGTVEELELMQEAQEVVWSNKGRTADASCGAKGHSREQLSEMSVDELHRLNDQLLLQIQKVFEELTKAVQEKDSLTSELHVRHIAIEQLFKNCAKLPWLHISRAGAKTSTADPAE